MQVFEACDFDNLVISYFVPSFLTISISVLVVFVNIKYILQLQNELKNLLTQISTHHSVGVKWIYRLLTTVHNYSLQFWLHCCKKYNMHWKKLREMHCRIPLLLHSISNKYLLHPRIYIKSKTPVLYLHVKYNKRLYKPENLHLKLKTFVNELTTILYILIVQSF